MITKLYKVCRAMPGLMTRPSSMQRSLFVPFLWAVLGIAEPCTAAPPSQGTDQRPGPERARELPAGERRSEEARQRDEERRPPRLSPEERRALRQQIHEAGHDLYRPKR